MKEVIQEIQEWFAQGHQVATATVVAKEGSSPRELGAVMAVNDAGEDSSEPPIASLGNAALDALVSQEAKIFLTKGLSQLRDYGNSLKLPLNLSNTQTKVLIQSFLPPPRLIIIGAINFSNALCQVGLLDYHLRVCDARSRFATVARFPQADQVEIEWPHHYMASTAIDSRFNP